MIAVLRKNRLHVAPKVHWHRDRMGSHLCEHESAQGNEQG